MTTMAQDDVYAGRAIDLANPCFLIRHPDGDLLWDAGLPDSLADIEGGVDEGWLHSEVMRPLAEQLAAAGADAAKIKYFSMSHSHLDHVGNVALLEGATFLLNRKEREFMLSLGDFGRSELKAILQIIRHAPTIEFEGDFDVFGDGTVVVVSTPGHTPGHSSLKIELENSGTILLSGDLYHFNEARTRRTAPRYNTGPAETLASMGRFEDIANKTNARVVVQHSMEDFRALPKPPEYLD